MKDLKEQIKHILRLIWQNKYRLFSCGVALCILFGGSHYFESRSQASVDIYFNYSEASQGLSPNKTRFNSYELVSDDILQNAIERVGLQGTITSSQLAGCLYLKPVDTGNVGGSSEYITTTYYMSLNASTLDLKNRKAMDLLRGICASYRAFFLENYCDNQEIPKEKLEVTSECEPYLRLNEIQLRAQQLSRYLNARLDENKSFIDTDNGDRSSNNFTTMGKRVNNLINYDIPNAMAFVIEGGVARDPLILTRILEYKNKIDDITARKNMAYYDANKNGISIYEKSMTAVVMIPTTDELQEYYMSRTKTAMDKMARTADDSLGASMDYQSEIISTGYIIQKINESADNWDRLSAAQGMVNKLEEELNSISEDLFVLDKAYIKYKSQNYITFTYNDASFAQRINAKKTLMQTILVMAGGCAFFYVRANRKEKRGRASEKI